MRASARTRSLVSPCRETMEKPVFYDPQRKRWKRLRRIFDVLALFGLVLGIIFAIGVFRMGPLPELTLTSPIRNYHALAAPRKPVVKPGVKPAKSPHRKTTIKPSQVNLNTGEGLRAAYYVDWDPASYSSLKEHVKQIDLLFPEWLHVLSAEGTLYGFTVDGNRTFPVVDKSGVHSIDSENKIARVLAENKVDTEVFPLLNNYDPQKNTFSPAIVDFMANPAARAHFLDQLDRMLTAFPTYGGICLDFEGFPDSAQAAYQAFLTDLYNNLHARNKRLYVNTPVDDVDFDIPAIAAHADALLLMDQDEHQSLSAPGPIASQDWFVDNLQRILKTVPKEKIIVTVGSYGYDWTLQLPPPNAPQPAKPIHGHAAPVPDLKVLTSIAISTQEAWQAASDSDAQIELDPDALNAHFAYDDEDAHTRHEVWFLDAVTVLNEMRAARLLGLQTFSLWHLGSEDDSLWKIWDAPLHADPAKDLAVVPPGYDVDSEGTGDVLRITRKPQSGHRTLVMDDDDSVPVPQKMVTKEAMDSYPLTYTVEYHGYKPRQVALSFDDGPDPTWTPRILDVLKKYNVKGTFFMIGEVAEDNVSTMQRVFREGHEIGNHTFTHPDISDISAQQLDLELTLTERLFGSKLGVQPLYFRPPYSIDQEPDTDDQAAPIDRIQAKGYTVVANKIDTNDWDEHPRKTPREIADSVLQQLDDMQGQPDREGSIILLHDGGGDRSATVAALPLLITTLRAHGYEIVPVHQLIGLTRDQVMPPLTGWKQHAQAFFDSITFFFLAFFNHFVIFVFYIGDVLMSARLIIIGVCAIVDRFRKRKNFAGPDYNPRVAVLIPAYNEEKVIARTVRSVMMSNYKNLRIVVIDDGSKDRTYDVCVETYAQQIADGRLTVLKKPNGGKADALNYALNLLDEDIYVGIDADGVIAHDAITNLVPHFANPRIGAVAGNAKVGNRVNLWTRWQALEYITSQNFERRALDLFNVVMVVPGAIGAWRTAPVKAGGGYHTNTVAEDADLTMNLLEQGYQVIYEDRALAFTEAPINADGLMRQRFRWSFGILQAIFKHRAAITKNRAMGLFALPNILIFQILLPLVSPFIDLMFVAGLIHYAIDKHFHPETASTDSLIKLVSFFLAFLAIDFAASGLAFMLERKHPASKGDVWLLFHIWIQRFTYRQVFSVVLFKTIKRAIDGKPFNWDKLERTAKMSKETETIVG
jgi:cellulose synthase/poly-beta-1,6-N-acetylglucosamine synthase-like glycosyltransferase/peptidoglycan/xylan/chitin deacetylase (PgdA/CDA1 family)/spore germination protein YaaH